MQVSKFALLCTGAHALLFLCLLALASVPEKHNISSHCFVDCKLLAFKLKKKKKVFACLSYGLA